MGKRSIAIAALVIALLAGYLMHRSLGREKTLFYEEFSVCIDWDRQCTRTDINNNPVIPSQGIRFRTSETGAEDGMLHLYTGDAGHIGGGEWSRDLNIKLDKDAFIQWNWAACDAGEYQFWIKIGFSDNRTIYYTASDSKPPGLYKGERLTTYRGTRYRDKEGRLRFFPSVTILTGVPQKDWMTLTRCIADDYIKSYGDLPGDFRIIDITIGMMDDSMEHVNELGLDRIRIFIRL